ncbi:hypothetical protein GCM10011588_26720 [Nocardia jinanensis]|uniref:Uncharacterized protein n=1 Tax=Nocardia jinanensis TaxID=382504 RepID=A0A917RJZ2_9NOCA|nr:hypothetical protein GCM10011588_26720 [Nocardia jinanensis]
MRTQHLGTVGSKHADPLTDLRGPEEASGVRGPCGRNYRPLYAVSEVDEDYWAEFITSPRTLACDNCAFRIARATADSTHTPTEHPEIDGSPRSRSPPGAHEE